MAFALPEFRGGLPAAEVDRSLRSALASYDTARRCALVWFCEVLSRSLHRDLGFATMEQYATQALGFSRNRYWQFMRMASDLERLEPLRQAVMGGRLGWTKAQHVGRVATPQTAELWVEKAAQSSRRELAQGIKEAREAARKAARRAVRDEPRQAVLPLAEGPALAAVPPARVSVSLSFEALDAARLEAMIEAGKKAGLIPAAARREEAILIAMSVLLEGGDGGAVRRHTDMNADDQHGPASSRTSRDLRRRNSATPYKVVLYRCRACHQTEVVTSSGRRKLDPAAAAATVENATIHDRGKNRSAIPPAVREKVLARDGHRCQSPGCTATRFLELHHKIPREQGGTNDPRNLITLCSRCHRHTHVGPAARSVERAAAGP
jgi:hypothetical protein